MTQQSKFNLSLAGFFDWDALGGVPCIRGYAYREDILRAYADLKAGCTQG